MNETNVEPDAGVRESSTGQPLIVCTTLYSSPSWRWFAPRFGKARWEFFGGKPRNWLERTIKRPALAQWRACWESIQTARREHAALVISHDARVTFRCAVRAVAGTSNPTRGLGLQLHDVAPGRIPAVDGLNLHPGRSVHHLLDHGAVTLRGLLWHRPCAHRSVALGRGTAAGRAGRRAA